MHLWPPRWACGKSAAARSRTHRIERQRSGGVACTHTSKNLSRATTLWSNRAGRRTIQPAGPAGLRSVRCHRGMQRRRESAMPGSLDASIPASRCDPPRRRENVTHRASECRGARGTGSHVGRPSKATDAAVSSPHAILRSRSLAMESTLG
eukprot:2737342-Prymnesium_polylepis.1